MPPLPARQQLDDEAALAVAARPQHDAFILPLHASALEIEPHRLVAPAVLGPVVGHPHEQEEVDAAAQLALKLGAGAGADLRDLVAALAQHDRLLAGTL